jgi:TRAP-type C4-dicarboxylate transport system permease large subunit
MWNKLYLAVLGLSIAVMAFFTYYSWSWLQSIGLPVAAAEGYEYYSGLAWTALWLFAAALLIVGNAVLWTTSRFWAMWSTFLYVAVVLITYCFWLEQAFLHFNKENGLSDKMTSLAPITAVVLIVLMAIVVFFDIFFVVRLRAKMYRATEPLDSAETEIQK